MRVFQALYMEAEKIAKKGEFSAPLWFFNFLPKLMRAANCAPFCLKPFCREVQIKP